MVAKELSLGVTGCAPVVPSGFSVMISEEESSIPGMSSDESIGDVSLVSGICGVVLFLSSVVLVVSVVPPVHPVSIKQKTSKHSMVISIFFMLLFRSAAITAFYIEAKLNIFEKNDASSFGIFLVRKYMLISFRSCRK